MRRVLLISLIFGAMTMIAGALGSLATAAAPAKEMAVVDIPDKTKVLKATLQGKYIFVHDDEKMARGESCFYIYEFSQDPAGCSSFARSNSRAAPKGIEFLNGSSMAFHAARQAGSAVREDRRRRCPHSQSAVSAEHHGHSESIATRHKSLPGESHLLARQAILRVMRC